jgi:hypothetical protein
MKNDSSHVGDQKEQNEEEENTMRERENVSVAVLSDR